ncbi:hypothetical protein CU097_008152 [Rhizopus azygosporus]|uniref:Uncharacterized protein n=2 Tax=Rhizopus TaxID=4842 RepID=A0A367JLB6_RHIAZ|nr:hypothetical protein BCV71DRAFT_228326 [Rhizopus microsporus]RCH90732.1 hypothetical protein CU097_008152 [Rhizopus azygosporus]
MSLANQRCLSICHVIMLMLVQLNSILVISLNSALLYNVKNIPLNDLIGKPDLEDYSLLLLGLVSFFSSTLLLLTHSRTVTRISFSYSYPLLAVEIMVSIVLIALLTTTTTIVAKPSQVAACNSAISNASDRYNNICNIFRVSVIMTYLTVLSWILVLLATLVSLTYTPLTPTLIYTVESPLDDSVQNEKVSIRQYGQHSANMKGKKDVVSEDNRVDKVCHSSTSSLQSCVTYPPAVAKSLYENRSSNSIHDSKETQLSDISTLVGDSASPSLVIDEEKKH